LQRFAEAFFCNLKCFSKKAVTSGNSGNKLFCVCYYIKYELIMYLIYSYLYAFFVAACCRLLPLVAFFASSVFSGGNKRQQMLPTWQQIKPLNSSTLTFFFVCCRCYQHRGMFYFYSLLLQLIKKC
jgi:hypothetical protein